MPPFIVALNVKRVSAVQLLVLLKRDRRCRAVSALPHLTVVRIVKALLRRRDILEERSLTFALPSNRIGPRWNVRDCNVSASSPLGVPTILMHRQLLRHAARNIQPSYREYERKRERERDFPSLVRRIRLFASFQSITIRNNVRRNDVFNVKTITTDATRMRSCAFRAAEFNQKNWLI